MPFDTEEEAVAIANDTAYGLTNYVQTADGSRARRVARRLRTGQVFINGADFDVNAPAGGYKQSGIGRENGTQAVEYYTQIKTIYTNLGDVPKTY